MAKILLVDDDNDFRAVIADFLRELGHEVGEARGGIEAFHSFDLCEFHLLITDLIMADGDGVDLIARTRARVPSLPIIAISGATNISLDYLAVLALQLGAKKFLAKPLDLGKLQEAIQELTSGTFEEPL